MMFLRLAWQLFFEWLVAHVPRLVGLLLYSWAKRCRHCAKPLGEHYSEALLCEPSPEPKTRYVRVGNLIFHGPDLQAKQLEEEYERQKVLSQERRAKCKKTSDE